MLTWILFQNNKSLEQLNLQNSIFYHPYESINFQPAGLLKIALIVTPLNWIRHTKSKLDLYFVYQKSLKRTFQTRFWVQNYLLSLCFRVLNSQRLFCIKKLVWSGIQSVYIPKLNIPFPQINKSLDYYNKKIKKVFIKDKK